jgi:hypothetical protein
MRAAKAFRSSKLNRLGALLSSALFLWQSREGDGGFGETRPSLACVYEHADQRRRMYLLDVADNVFRAKPNPAQWRIAPQRNSAHNGRILNFEKLEKNCAGVCS